MSSVKPLSNLYLLIDIFRCKVFFFSSTHVLTAILVGLLQQPESSALHMFRKSHVPLEDCRVEPRYLELAGGTKTLFEIAGVPKGR